MAAHSAEQQVNVDNIHDLSVGRTNLGVPRKLVDVLQVLVRELVRRVHVLRFLQSWSKPISSRWLP